MATSGAAHYYLPFEADLQKLDEQIHRLEDWSKTNSMDVERELSGLRSKRDEFLSKTYQNLTAWDRVQVARHNLRPQTRDYIELLCDDFLELHGDRGFADDRAMVTGFATISGRRMMLIGQHKGRDVKERSECNFGMPQPEGYRKALLKMRLAEKLRLPILCLIDTKGAAPDIGAEERGQSQAIAYNLMVMAGLKTPILCIVIGEGGSGGALGIGVGDRLLMQEFAYFSVIAPEGCASILWRDANKKAEAATALKITAPELQDLGIVDGILEEPRGGAHRDKKAAAAILKTAVDEHLRELSAQPLPALLEARYRKLRALGRYREETAGAGGEGNGRHAVEKA